VVFILEEDIEDMKLARTMLLESDYSVVVVKKGEILTKKRGGGLTPMLEVIDELGPRIGGSTVGDRILGKASALLCAYSHVGGVYAHQATKTAIAILIRAGIMGQTDEMIPFVKNKKRTGMCPFEELLVGVESPEEAYEILKKNLDYLK
jgi:hypothetical protein